VVIISKGCPLLLVFLQFLALFRGGQRIDLTLALTAAYLYPDLAGPWLGFRVGSYHHPLLVSPKRGEESSRGAQDCEIFGQNLASQISSSPKLREVRRG